MKKKLVSVLLALVMIIGVTALAMLGVGAEEATAATHSDHCVCGGGRNGRGDHVCGEALTGWTAFSEDLLILADEENCRYNLPAGSYYLPGDMTLTDKEINILPDTEVTFCLNGFKLTANKRVFRVNGVLNITDCYANGNGRITGEAANAPVFYGYSGGHINLYGGILTAKTGVTRNWGGVGALATDEGSAAAKGSSSMTMYGGAIDASKLTIVKNSSGSHGNGGAVVLMGATFDLDGDDIKETAYPATFIQYGGTIKGAKSVANNGGAIYGNSLDTIKILGGTVTAGSAAVGDGVAKASGSGQLVVGGNCKIEDLYLRAGQTFTTENLTGSVGLSTAENNFAVLATVSETEAACFTSNMLANHELTYTDGNLAFAPYHADHCVCGGSLTDEAAVQNHGTCADITGWIGLSSENITTYLTASDTEDGGTASYYMFADDYDTGSFYLTENITLDVPVEIHTDDNVTLCLNGYTITYTKGTNNKSALRIWGTLNLTDCIGEGVITSNATCEGGMVYMLNTKGAGVLNIYGGTLQMTDKSTSSDSGIIRIGNNGSYDAVVNIYGGTLKNGYGSNGGNIRVNRITDATGASVLNLYGGTITGGNASGFGGNIYVSGLGEFYMYGGTVSSGKAATYGGNVYVNGTGLFEMRGGSILSGTADSRGGSVYLNNKAAVFNMYDGTIDGGTAKDRGGNVYVNAGAFNMYGGTVINGVLTEAGYGADIAKGAPDTATDSAILLDGKVRIGEVGVYGTSNGSGYAISVGESFSTEEVIKVNASGVNKRVLTGVAPEDYQWFAAANEGEQVTYENKGIHVRSADDHYACYCGGTYITGGEVISHTCYMVKWTPVTNEMISSGTTTTETREVTDADGNPVLDADGNPTTEEVTVVTGFGSPVNYDNSALGGNYYEVPEGNYYLAEDITLEYGLRVVKDTEVRIDLNGHTLTAPADGTRAFFVQGSLRVCDSSYDASKENKAEQFQGAVIGMNTANYNIAYISGGGAIRIFGGNYYSAAEGKANYSRIAMVGELYVFDGYFKGGDAAGNGRMFELHDNSSHTTHGYVGFYRATAEGGNTNNGGVITMSNAGQSFYMHSGTLIGGTATANGGAVYAAGGTVKINGGQIMNGNAKLGGNIYAGSDATLTISGGTISDGVATGEGGNIYTVDLNMTGGTISGGTSASYGGSMYITGTASISGGTVMNGVSTSTTRSGGNICQTGGTLTVSGEAVISGGQAREGGNISCRGGGTINIEGGTIEGGQASNHGGNIVVFNTLNISGGVIRNGSAVWRGGNISTYGNTGAITVTGGQILDGILLGDGETAAADLYGANISMLSVVNKPLTLTITGGTIGGFGEGCVEGVTSVHVQSSGDEITTTVGGTAVIDELRLGTGRMLTIAEGGFSEGASIGITRFEITGVFAPNAAADYSAYFHGTKEGTSVEAVATETGYDLVLVSSIPYWAFDASNNPVGPAKTIADAMALEGATFVRLVSDYTTDEVVEGDLHLDLYGYDLTGLTVNGNLYAVDYKGHDYEEGVLGKLISFTGTVQNVYTSDREVHSGVRTYVALANEDGSYSFHRVSVSISHVSLKADADALGFKATVKGDAQVLAAITGFGFNMGVEGGNMRSFKLEGNPTDGVFTLRLKGIMAANGGEMTVIGQPVIFFGEDSVTGSEKKTSMKETVEAVEAAVEKDPNAYTEAQITTVQKLIAAYESGMTDWNIDAIKAWAPATEDETTTA